MYTFVINLDKDAHRRDFIATQMASLAMEYELYPGVLGSALTSTQLAECYDQKKTMRKLCKTLTPSEIGCALSHIGVYREIINRNLSCALILEDDVVLPDSLPKLLPEINKIINPDYPEVVLLSPAVGDRNSSNVRALSLGYRFSPYRQGYYTSSYIVTNLAARALLKELYPVGDVADCWDRMHRYKVVDISIIDPPLINQDQDTFGSSTTEDINRVLKKDILSRLLFKTCRVFAKSFDLFYAIYRRRIVPYAGLYDARSTKS